MACMANAQAPTLPRSCGARSTSWTPPHLARRLSAPCRCSNMALLLTQMRGVAASALCLQYTTDGTSAADYMVRLKEAEKVREVLGWLAWQPYV